MEEGSFRCDANISLRPVGSAEYGAKVEVKNMNSFRGVYRALKYEQERQFEVLENGGKLRQETRGWLDGEGITVAQRSKEYAEDYRYFPEPDLPPLVLERAWVDEITAQLPELPDARRTRFVDDFGVSAYDAGVLVSSRAMADFFDRCLEVGGGEHGKAISNWLLGDVSRLLNADGVEISDCRLKPEDIAALVELVDIGTVSGPAAKSVLDEMYVSGKPPAQIVEERNLGQISGSDELVSVIRQVIADNPKAVSDYRAGKAQSVGFLTGQVMKKTRGRANPGLTRELLEKELG
jgi:aspartyl-tRNA(Asn)/glutamyl-tRNA(Gln) amidotransferase subunit B